MELNNEEYRKMLSECEDSGKGDYLTLMYCKQLRDEEIHECKASCGEENPDWSYYQLRCGHIFHTRCLRLWLNMKGKLNCPLCGDVPKDKMDSHLWCMECEQWGHASLDKKLCKTWKRFIADERKSYGRFGNLVADSIQGL